MRLRDSMENRYDKANEEQKAFLLLRQKGKTEKKVKSFESNSTFCRESIWIRNVVTEKQCECKRIVALLRWCYDKILKITRGETKQTMMKILKALKYHWKRSRNRK